MQTDALLPVERGAGRRQLDEQTGDEQQREERDQADQADDDVKDTLRRLLPVLGCARTVVTPGTL